MSRFEDCREHPRVAISGEAFWTAERIEGRCRLVNLSASGAGIADAVPALSVGTRLHVTLAINGLHLEFVPVEVARMSDEAMGLRFRDLSDELRSGIEALVQDLIAPS